MSGVDKIVQKHMDAMHESLGEYLAEQGKLNWDARDGDHRDFEAAVRDAVSSALLPIGDYAYWWKEGV